MAKKTTKKPVYPKYKNGKPRTYTDEIIIEALIAYKGLVYLAAKSIGCTAKTIYNRAAQSEAIVECMQAEREIVVDEAEEKLFKKIQKGDNWAIGYTLARLGRHRGYSEERKHTHDHKHQGGVKHDHEHRHSHITLSMQDIDALPLEVKKQLLETLRKKREARILEHKETSNDNSAVGQVCLPAGEETERSTFQRRRIGGVQSASKGEE